MAIAGTKPAFAKEVVIDVRTPQEFQAGHIPGALLIPHTEIAKQILKADVCKDDHVILYCYSGLALVTLKRMGFAQAPNYDGIDQAKLSLKN